MINVKHFLGIDIFAPSAILFEFKGDLFSINQGTENITEFPPSGK